MDLKMKAMIGVVVILVILGIVGSVFGFNTIKEERTAHELTKKALVDEKKKERVKTITKTIRIPVEVGGRVVFREETIIDNTRETDTTTHTETDERDRSETESSQRPAVKKWLAMAWAEPTTGRLWLGAGFRQSLWIVEASVWAGNPVPVSGTPEFRPAVGLTLAF